MPWGDGEEKVNPKTKETRNNTGTIPFTQHLTSQRHAHAENGADSRPHRPLNDPTKIKKQKHKTAMRRLLTLSHRGHTVRTGKAYKKNITTMASTETSVTFEVALLTKVQTHPEVSISLLRQVETYDLALPVRSKTPRNRAGAQ